MRLLELYQDNQRFIIFIKTYLIIHFDEVDNVILDNQEYNKFNNNYVLALVINPLKREVDFTDLLKKYSGPKPVIILILQKIKL